MIASNFMSSANSTAGPSTVPLKKKPSALKRKRSAEPADQLDDHPNSTPTTVPIVKEKKKKANRACLPCQKAHLTCNDNRPCQRCVKRDKADECVEGHRKKAKYLLDETELEALKKDKDTSKPSKSSAEKASSNKSALAAYKEAQDQLQQPLPQLQNGPVYTNDSPEFDPLFNMSFDPSYPFGSHAANMEYSILSAILGNPSPDDINFAPPSPPPSTTIPAFPTSLGLSNPSWPAVPQSQQFSLPQTQLSRSSGMGGMNSLDSTMDGTNSMIDGSPYTQRQQSSQLSASPEISTQERPSTHNFFRGSLNPNLAPPTPPDSDPSPPSPAGLNTDSPDVVASGVGGASGGAEASRTAASHATGTLQLQPFGQDGPISASASKQAMAIQHQRSINVYNSVTKPFDYVDGYHYLMQYLHGRFEKNDILRIVRALAIVRPSLIALQMPLSVEDEVFVEKCFQRTLIELEKLISFSGTPTIVWRRTGEICLVGLEFTMLTGWSREDLLGSRKFIYELFEHQSVVEYWEKFASHAFENSSQSVYSHCVLLKPDGKPVPCSFCFSIRRDVFDLPNVVIGQWLPLLL